MNSELNDVMSFAPSNTLVFENLGDLISKGIVLPFVGSGISAFAYKTWRKMLTDLCKGLDEPDKSEIEMMIYNGDLLEAANKIRAKLHDTLFFTHIRSLFAENKIDDNALIHQAAYFVPTICRGNVITTNYDRVLEHACRLRGISYDIADYHNTVKLTTYFRGVSGSDAGLIFKIHGDILSNNSDILLTKDSYNRHYAEGSPLREHLKKWMGGKTLLFLGSSLFNDEPINLLTNIVVDGMVNYAIYPCQKKDIGLFQDEFDKLGILPIFYDSTDHSLLTIILKALQPSIV